MFSNYDLLDHCYRLVSEMTAEKKLKSQKGKSKILEGRKQLDSARVIQRNLVYVVGLPLNFADEDVSITLLLLSCPSPIFCHSSYYSASWLAATSAKRIFWSVWKGAEGVNISNSDWSHTAVCKCYMQCVGPNI